ncbi:hypothetical protein LCGC14_1792980 [marine sediment metagenome]|uniref:Uncharacterized protein n=1 Tax=marine sediment metagenome TaxID=412755 RepID=A0A0F9GRY4_9ZZZZ
MKLTKQVISLELAKRLKELRVKQESLWYWCEQFMTIQGKKIVTSKLYRFRDDFIIHKLDRYEWYSAFTVSELVLLLLEYPDEGTRMHKLHEIYADYLARELIVYKSQKEK